MSKRECGLWHVHTEISEYNNNGHCQCLGCMGLSCHNCDRYRQLQIEISDEVIAAFKENREMRTRRCDLCMKYNGK